MIVLNRSGIASGLLLSLALARTVPAQTRWRPRRPPRLAPWPRRHWKVRLPTLSRFNATIGRCALRACRRRLRCLRHDSRCASSDRGARPPSERVHAPKQPPVRSPSGRQVAVQIDVPPGYRVTGIGIRRGGIRLDRRSVADSATRLYVGHRPMDARSGWLVSLVGFLDSRPR